MSLSSLTLHPVLRKTIALLSLPLLLTCASQAQAQWENMSIPDPIPASELPSDIDLTSLARLPQVQRDELDDAGKRAFDTYVSPGTGYETGLRGPVGMWMHSPALAEAVFDVRQRVRYGTDKDQRITELIILSTAREISNQYEWSAHEPLGRAAGLEEEIMEFIKWRGPMEEAESIAGFGHTEQTLVQFVRELVGDRDLSSETFAELHAIYGDEGVTDIVGLIGYYNFVAITLDAFDLQRTPDSALLLPILDE